MHKRTAVLAELAEGAKPVDLAKKYSVSQVTISYWKKKAIEKGEFNDPDIEVLTTIDPETLHDLAETAKKDAPEYVQDSIDKIIEGVSSLQKLEPKFHALVADLLEKATELNKDVTTVKEWKELASGISALYAAIFNKNSASVYINNQQNINNEKLNFFKSSMKA